MSDNNMQMGIQKEADMSANLEALWCDEAMTASAKLLASAYAWRGSKILELAARALAECNYHDEAGVLSVMAVDKDAAKHFLGKPSVG